MPEERKKDDREGEMNGRTTVLIAAELLQKNRLEFSSPFLHFVAWLVISLRSLHLALSVTHSTPLMMCLGLVNVNNKLYFSNPNM